MELRQRKTVLETVKKLDAFPKIADTYVETTRSGGTSKCKFMFQSCLSGD